MVKQYTPEELTQLHQVLYEILEEIVRICDKHNIPYFVIGGTAIGALYDKAILPWDDDIDIGMKREDYNKFLQIASQELREPYFLSWIHTDPHSPYYFAKVKKNNTLFVEEMFKDVPMQDCSANDLGIIPKHWNVMRLGYVSSMQNGYVGPTVDILVDEDEGQMYIQSLHVKNGKIVFGNDFYVTEKWGRTRPKLYEGDVVIVQTGDIGQVGLVAKEYDGKNCHALIICHTNKEIMCPEYLIYYFMSDIGQWQLLQYETGTTLKHLNSTKIKDSKVLIPPIDEQKDIATFLTDKCETVDSIIAVKTQQLESMRSHKQSLIFEYITGKKRVKEVR